VNMTDSDMIQDGNTFYPRRRGAHRDVDSSLCPL
jgi:hypothetical protein